MTLFLIVCVVALIVGGFDKLDNLLK